MRPSPQGALRKPRLGAGATPPPPRQFTSAQQGLALPAAPSADQGEAVGGCAERGRGVWGRG